MKRPWKQFASETSQVHVWARDWFATAARRGVAHPRL